MFCGFLCDDLSLLFARNLCHVVSVVKLAKWHSLIDGASSLLHCILLRFEVASTAIAWRKQQDPHTGWTNTAIYRRSWQRRGGSGTESQVIAGGSGSFKKNGIRNVQAVPTCAREVCLPYNITQFCRSLAGNGTRAVRACSYLTIRNYMCVCVCVCVCTQICIVIPVRFERHVPWSMPECTGPITSKTWVNSWHGPS